MIVQIFSLLSFYSHSADSSSSGARFTSMDDLLAPSSLQVLPTHPRLHTPLRLHVRSPGCSSIGTLGTCLDQLVRVANATQIDYMVRKREQEGMTLKGQITEV